MLKISDFVFQEWIEGDKFVEINVRIWVCKRWRLRISNADLKIFLIFFKEVSINTLFLGYWLNLRYIRRVLNRRLIEIITVINLNCKSFFMSEYDFIVFIRWTTAKLLEFNKVSLRETNIISRSRWSNRTTVEFQRMWKVRLNLHFQTKINVI